MNFLLKNLTLISERRIIYGYIDDTLVDVGEDTPSSQPLHRHSAFSHDKASLLGLATPSALFLKLSGNV